MEAFAVWFGSVTPSTTTTTVGAQLHGGAAQHLPVKLVLTALGVMLLGGVVMVALASVLHRRQTKGDLNAPGLFGVVGRMGGGKSYFLALAADRAKSSGRVVWANYAVEGCQRYSSWSEILGIPHCSVKGCVLGARLCKDNRGPMLLMDEVHLWFPSEAWKAPVEITALLSQLRKLKVTMLWASQHEAHVGKRLIRLSFAFWKCEHFRRGHRYTLFDSVGYGTAKQERLARMNVVRKQDVMASYDTYEIVQSSVEWGDGQGFEDLTIRSPSAGTGPRTAQRSGRRGRTGQSAAVGAGPSPLVSRQYADVGGSLAGRVDQDSFQP